MFAHFTRTWEISLKLLRFYSIPFTSWDMRYFWFGGRHTGFLTSAHIAQCSYCYIWVSLAHPRKHGYSRWNFNSISSTNRHMMYLVAAILDFWLPLTLHSVCIAIFKCLIELLILENVDIAVGILILSRLPADICGSSCLSAAIFNLWLPICQEAHIRSARWDTCSSTSPDTKRLICVLS